MRGRALDTDELDRRIRASRAAWTSFNDHAHACETCREYHAHELHIEGLCAEADRLAVKRRTTSGAVTKGAHALGFNNKSAYLRAHGPVT